MICLIYNQHGWRMREGILTGVHISARVLFHLRGRKWEVLYCTLLYCLWVGIAQSVLELATGWTVWGSNPGGSEIIRTNPERPLSPPSLLYNGSRVFCLGIKQPERGVDHPPLSSAEVKERLELYVHSLSRSSWPVLGWTFLVISISKVSRLSLITLIRCCIIIWTRVAT